ncbi:hypothetical protein DBV39_09185 [Orrella marina]|uniref:DUF2863 family protein n=2 Tax=Orrella marina TaxID=2163011 RepID=A0A2R4XJ71_9BURK|nr:hypothetical protein DBV39_09185 [Orrella marina]
MHLSSQTPTATACSGFNLFLPKAPFRPMPKPNISKPGKSTSAKLTRQILASALAFTNSESLYEENHWIRVIDKDLLKLLDRKKEREVEQLMNELTTIDPESSALVFERLQYLTEFATFKDPKTGDAVDCLLMTAPMLVWTRYTIPDVTLGEKELSHLIEGLKQHAFAPDVQVHCLPKFLSTFEMPLEFTRTRHWLQTLGSAALQGTGQQPKPEPYPEGVSLLADSRHLVMVAIAPQDSPIFRWIASSSVTRADVLLAWQQYAQAALADLFPGCQIEAVLPDAYHSSDSSARETLRPIGIKASVDWLQTALNITPALLRANIMRFGDDQYREFRIGYSRKGDPDVFFGTIWPSNYINGFTEDENDDTQILEQITSALNAAGIRDIRVLPGLAPSEYCGDCGAAMLPNQEGDIVHPEMPDEAFDMPQHFH